MFMGSTLRMKEKGRCQMGLEKRLHSNEVCTKTSIDHVGCSAEGCNPYQDEGVGPTPLGRM